MAMTDEQKRTMVNTLVGETLSTIVADVYLELSKTRIFEKRYPYGTDEDESVLFPRYDLLQCELASRMYLRKGAEGELVHNENGINRTYDSVDDKDLLDRVVPIIKVG